MQNGIVAKISAWTQDELSTEDLVVALDSAQESAEHHRQQFQITIDNLNDAQREHCADLIDFALSLLEQLQGYVVTIGKALQEENRQQVIGAGDMLARISFQLNQTFSEFRNQAMFALGPTDIPNLNWLLHLKEQFAGAPTEQAKGLLLEAVEAERSIAYQAMLDLNKEPQLPEVMTASNAFWEHLQGLNALYEELQKNAAPAAIEFSIRKLQKSYGELKELVPAVQVALKSDGPTAFPDLNYLITMIQDVSLGRVGDAPFMEALEAVEMHFSELKESFEAVKNQAESALIRDELEKTLESYTEFDDGVEAAYRFLEERERLWLIEAEGCLKTFGELLAGHQSQLKELEEQKHSILCPRCAVANSSERTRCSGCGNPLPQNVAATESSTFVAVQSEGSEAETEDEPELLITSNLEKLYLAINRVQAGEAPIGELLREIEQLERLIEVNSRNLPAPPQTDSPEAQQSIDAIYGQVETGFEEMLAGLEVLRGYEELRDDENLLEGVRRIDSGAKAVQASREAVATQP